MNKIRILTSDRGEYMGHQIFCPACRIYHKFKIGDGGHGFDGNMQNPTVYPELLTKPRPHSVCHFMIIRGDIHFQADCTHMFRNLTLELPTI